MRTEAKSQLVAFLLSFIPGLGHLYIGRVLRFLLYGGGFLLAFSPLVIVFFTYANPDAEFVLLFLVASFFIWGCNLLDMIITIAKGNHPAFRSYELSNGIAAEVDPLAYIEQQEKTKIMLLSFIPGLAHMYMGLLQRGLTLLISFVVAFGGVLFVSIVLNAGSVLILWLALPVIWVYGMFDAMSILRQKQQGEEVVDQSLFEHLEQHLAGKKSRGTAMILSIFPGAGHLYIGLQQRGLQIMGLFLLSIFIMDQLRLTLFLFLLPMIWCYAFFDVMTQLRKLGEGTTQDEPIIVSIRAYQRWIGAGLLIVGVYFLIDRIAERVIVHYFSQWQQQYYELKYMLPTIAIAFILILLGIRLLFGTSVQRNKHRNGEGE